jgi:hypothetical protein
LIAQLMAALSGRNRSCLTGIGVWRETYLWEGHDNPENEKVAAVDLATATESQSQEE